MCVGYGGTNGVGDEGVMIVHWWVGMVGVDEGAVVVDRCAGTVRRQSQRSSSSAVSVGWRKQGKSLKKHQGHE
jgi:hypothetical protein